MLDQGRFGFRLRIRASLQSLISPEKIEATVAMSNTRFTCAELWRMGTLTTGQIKLETSGKAEVECLVSTSGVGVVSLQAKSTRGSGACTDWRPSPLPVDLYSATTRSPYCLQSYTSITF